VKILRYPKDLWPILRGELGQAPGQEWSRCRSREMGKDKEAKELEKRAKEIREQRKK